jgi:hypothetical protein
MRMSTGGKQPRRPCLAPRKKVARVSWCRVTKKPKGIINIHPRIDISRMLTIQLDPNAPKRPRSAWNFYEEAEYSVVDDETHPRQTSSLTKTRNYRTQRTICR